MVERLPFKEKVGGPIPPGLTILEMARELGAALQRNILSLSEKHYHPNYIQDLVTYLLKHPLSFRGNFEK